jgi:hypothetical protein
MFPANGAMVRLHVHQKSTVQKKIDPLHHVRGTTALRIFLFSCLANLTVFDFFGAKIRFEHLTWPFFIYFILQNKAIESQTSGKGIKSAKIFLIIWFSLALFSSSFLARNPIRSYWVACQILFGIFIFLRLSNSSLSKVVFQQAKTVLSFFLRLHAVIFLLTPIRSYLPGTIFSLDQRFIGFTYEANVLAGIATLWIAIAYTKSEKHDLSRRSKIDLLASLLVIFSTGTRAAIISILLLSVVIIVEKIKNQKYLSLIGSFYGLVILFVSVSALNFTRILGDPQSLVNRLATALDFNSETLVYRLRVYEIAINDIRQSDVIYKLLGRGLNAFSQTHQIDISQVENAYLSNLPLSLLYDTGIIGLFFFVLFIVRLISTSFQLDRVSIGFWFALLIATSTTNMFWFCFIWLFITFISSTNEKNKSGLNSSSL